MKLITIVGARPQFIKAAAVSRAIRKSPDIKEIIVHTGQHFDNNMSDVFFREMDIPQPDYHMGVNNLTHGAMTGRMIELIEQVLINEKPDTVLVYGDTNSTLAGALAAKKLNLRIAHVEAGLRSFNMKMPEEINRILTDRISDLLFCPTVNAVNNLLNEGFNNFPGRFYNVGDVMYDAAVYYGSKSSQQTDIINRLNPENKEFVLCTVHRQENTDDPEKLKSIIEALNEINLKIPVVLPLHPRTRKIIEALNIPVNFKPIDPVGYFEIVELLKHCSLVITDSGGMQKEAYFFKKYCITLREETEWTELSDNGFNYLAGSDKSKILSLFERLRLTPAFSDRLRLYGEGNACEKIVQYLSVD